MAQLQAGDTLQMERAGATLIVADRIGEGGQGVVHRARLSGVPFAVKWYRGGPGTVGSRAAIAALVDRGGPPHPAFVWPIDLVTSRRLPGFGYVMPLLGARFGSLAQSLDVQPALSFRVTAQLGLRLVDAFAALHSSGLCYRDISFGNLLADAGTCEIAIIDVDNIGVDGAPALIKGTGPFMAPEILRDETLPSTATDLHSLAVLLFYLFMHGHPLLGSRADACYSWDDGYQSETGLLVSNLGRDPLFVFDPGDPSNSPLPGDPMNTWWPVYPGYFRQVFTEAFTSGLRDASLHGRVLEGTWRRVLLRLADAIWACPRCQAAVLYDPDQPGQACWDCRVTLPVPPRLSLPGATLVLAEGSVLTRHHLYRDRDYRSVLGVVEPHPGHPGALVLRNLSQQPWLVAPEGEEPKTVAPGQRVAVRPMTIGLCGTRAHVLLEGTGPDLAGTPDGTGEAVAGRPTS